MKNTLFFIIFLCFCTLGAVADGATATRANTADKGAVQAQIGLWGFDLDGMQKDVAPGDDFYKFANGAWQESAVIAPGDRSGGALQRLLSRADQKKVELVADLLETDWPENSDEAKFLNIYNAYLDRDQVDSVGVGPLRGFTQLISSARTHADIAEVLGHIRVDTGGLFRVAIRVDPENGQGYLPSLEPARLLLGRKHHYLSDAPESVAMRGQAIDQLAGLLRNLERWGNGKSRVRAVLELETRLAALYPENETLRDPSRDNLFLSLEDLERVAPAFPWETYFEKQDISQTDRLHIRVGENVTALAEVFAQTPVRVWRDYLRLRLLDKYGAYLSDDIAQEAEAFRALRRGVAYVRPSQTERATMLAERLMPDVLGRAYMESQIDPEKLERVQAIAEAIREAYRARIYAAEWLSAGTKTRAVAKLDAVQFMIGGPPGWNNYATYFPKSDKLFTNVYWARQLRRNAAVSRLDRPAGDPRPDLERLRSHLFFSPLVVGAYYLPRVNVIIIPANYLQTPYYDANADAAVNFGALGSTIGHELGHAFDDQGSAYGPEGQLENWWTPQDSARFSALGAKLSDQFANYEAAPGLKVNTTLTLGENLSDLAGLEVAFLAYQQFCEARDCLLPDADEAKRRFLLGYAQKRRAVRLPHIARDLALTDPHSPPVHRVNGIMRNLDIWYEAFGVTEGDALWLAPEDRVKIW